MSPGSGFSSRNEGYSDDYGLDPELGLDYSPDLVQSKSSFASEPIRRNSGPLENRVLAPTNMKKVVEGNDALEILKYFSFVGFYFPIICSN